MEEEFIQMENEDTTRYFIIATVFLEIVTPLFQDCLKKEYKIMGLNTLEDFLNSQTVLHKLFHLYKNNNGCCKNKIGSSCKYNSRLPLNNNQWILLYTENVPVGQRNHICHCKYTGNPVLTSELDLTLSSLILLNCCNVQKDDQVIRTLRQFKNDYLSHNTKTCITEIEFNKLWSEMKKCIIQLDNSKEDDLIRLKRRPLDKPLCEKYSTILLNIHEKLSEFDTKLESFIKKEQDAVKWWKFIYIKSKSIIVQLLSIIYQILHTAFFHLVLPFLLNILKLSFFLINNFQVLLPFMKSAFLFVYYKIVWIFYFLFKIIRLPFYVIQFLFNAFKNFISKLFPLLKTALLFIPSQVINLLSKILKLLCHFMKFIFNIFSTIFKYIFNLILSLKTTVILVIFSIIIYNMFFIN